MRHLRTDYEAIQAWPTQRPHITRDNDGFSPLFEEDEPVFILRPRDITASTTVRFWAEEVSSVGGDENLVARVLAWADHMDEWAEEHGGFKIPDTSPELLRDIDD